MIPKSPRVFCKWMYSWKWTQRFKLGYSNKDCGSFHQRTKEVTWRPGRMKVDCYNPNVNVIFMTLIWYIIKYIYKYKTESRELNKDTGIDGNACEETTKDQRWVGHQEDNTLFDNLKYYIFFSPRCFICPLSQLINTYFLHQHHTR